MEAGMRRKLLKNKFWEQKYKTCWREEKTRHYCNVIFALLFIATTSFGVILNSVPSVAAGCNDVEFIFVRGSGESLNGPNYQAWRSSLEERLGHATLSYNFYELGSQKQMSYQYPAAAVSGNFWAGVNMVEAYLTAGEAGKFGKSVEEGINELKAYITKTSSLCHKTEYVLGGYSQGAMIISKAIHDIHPAKIIYAATFGDPKIYLPEGSPLSEWLLPKTPDACMGQNLSEYRADVPDCQAYTGVLGSHRPYQPDGYAGKLGTWCNDGDIMCSSQMSISDHSKYISSNRYKDAAQVIWEKLKNRYPDQTQNDKDGLNIHDLVFLLDVTWSMDPYIKKYSEQQVKLFKEVRKHGGRVAAYEYRDLRDMVFPAFFVNCDFECQEKNFPPYRYASDCGGGDADESLLSALRKALLRVEWRRDVTKSIVVLTDAGYHSPDFDATTIEDIVELSLSIDPVNIYVIAPEELRETYRELTERTGGAFFDVESELSLSTESIFNRPVAKLSNLEYYGEVGDVLKFDAGNSYGFGNEDLIYEWDLEGNGNFVAGQSIVEKQFNSEFEGFVQVRVTDEKGSSTMSAKVKIVQKRAVEQASEITELGVERVDDDTTHITFETNAEKVLVSLDDALLGFVAVEEGKGNFTMGELVGEQKLTLTPYSQSGRRGIARSAVLSGRLDDQGQIPIDPDPDTTNPVPPVAPDQGTTAPVKPDNPDADKMPTYPATGLIPSQDDANTLTQDQPAFIPKSPDTGVADVTVLQRRK